MTQLGIWSTYFYNSGTGSPALLDYRCRYVLSYEQDQATNQTTILVQHYIQYYCEGNYYEDVQPLTSKVTINGASQTLTKAGESQRHFARGYENVLIGTTTHVVTHNDMGEANCNFSASAKFGSRTRNASHTWALPTIPQASSIIADVMNQYLGEEISFTITPKEPTYVHVLKYKYGTSSEVQIATNVSTSYDWTPPIDMAQYVTDNNYGTATIYCYSYDGSVAEENYKGVSSTTIRLDIPNDLVPTCYLYVEDANTTTTNEFGKVPASWEIFVKGYSKLRLSSYTSLSYGATIKEKVYMNVDGEQSSSDPFLSPNFVSSVGLGDNNVIVTDSRGMQGIADARIDVQDYAVPSARLNVIRCDNNGNYNANGENVKATIDYTITDLLNDLGQSCNSKHYILKYRAKGDVNYITLRDLDLSNYSGTIDIVITNITFSIGTTYEFVLVVNDQLSMAEATAILPYSRKPISIKKTTGVTIGRHATADGFNVYYDAKFYGLMDYGVIAYDNPNGDNGNITLDYDASNYNHCIIIYKTDDADAPESSVRIDNPDGKSVMLMGVQPYTSLPACYLKFKKVSISGTTISNVSYSEVSIRNNTSPSLSNNNNIYILKVIFF